MTDAGPKPTSVATAWPSGRGGCPLSIDPVSHSSSRRPGGGRDPVSHRGDPSWSSVVPDRLADVSSLWTPGGEYPVGDRRTSTTPSEPDEADLAGPLEDEDLDEASV